MNAVTLSAGMATLLSAGQLVPQVVKARRVTSTAGLSPSWAIMGIAINAGWVAYRWSQELWIGLLSPTIACVLYVGVLWLIASSWRSQWRGWVLGSLVAVSLTLAATFGSWGLVGGLLGFWSGVQVGPAVWAAYRSPGPHGIAVGVWVIGAIQALLWAYYGWANRDVALMAYGVVLVTGSWAILVRYWMTRRTRDSGVSQGSLVALLQKPRCRIGAGLRCGDRCCLATPL